MSAQLLQRAGWSDDRRVDTSEYEKRLKSEGYLVHAVVVDFLERFGGLLVVHLPKGYDTRAIQAYLGHKNIQHIVRYTELAPGRFKDFWTD